MINITIIQYGGMTYRVLRNLAIKLDKTRFNVTYLWCEPGKDLYSDFKHPVAPNSDIENFKKEMENNGVVVKEFSVGKRFIPDPMLPWQNTDFWEIYNSIKTDIVFTWKGGREEYPFVHLNEMVVEWNVFGGYDNSTNLVKSLAVSPLCQEIYMDNGGNEKKSEVVFLPVIETQTEETFREELNIPSDAIVCGMHQRAEDTIFSPVSLNAIKYVQSKVEDKIYIVFLGGSRLYEKYAKEIGLEGYFLYPSGEREYQNSSGLASDYTIISKFLNTLTIYTHARKDGETLGAAIQEAMFHGLPVVSHTSQWNAHIDTIGPGGRVCETQEEYNNTLLEWLQNLDKAKEIGMKGQAFAEARYSWRTILDKIEKVFEDVYENKKEFQKEHIPLPLSIYNRRKPYYFIRFYLLKFVTNILVKFFGQKSTMWLPKMKNLLINNRWK